MRSPGIVGIVRACEARALVSSPTSRVLQSSPDGAAGDDDSAVSSSDSSSPSITSSLILIHARSRHHSLSGVTTAFIVAPTAPGRTIHQGDALPWLRAAGTLAGASVVTSLPDSS